MSLYVVFNFVKFLMTYVFIGISSCIISKRLDYYMFSWKVYVMKCAQSLIPQNGRLISLNSIEFEHSIENQFIMGGEV